MLTTRRIARRLALGAEPTAEGVSFRIWAPGRRTVSIVYEQSGGANHHSFELRSEAGGYFAGIDVDSFTGRRYQVCLDRSKALLPDPASRWQPDGPLGHSQIIDPSQF